MRKNEKRILKENMRQEKRESKRLVKEERKLKKDKRVGKEEDSDKILLAYVVSNGQFF